MKHQFIGFLGVVCAFLLATLPSFAQPLQPEDALTPEAAEPDPITVSLLTCSPSDKEVYTLFGHTAIRLQDRRTGDDWAFNYGVFNFNKPFFALRFLFGITDYELGVIPYELFVREYQRMGRGIVEQRIQMTTEEKWAIREALARNYNTDRIYRYNFLTNNCTTKARDMIDRCIGGSINYRQQRPASLSYREMVRECTKGHPWITFTNDICLGLTADQSTDIGQQQFLPNHLMQDFEKATVTREGQTSASRLVEETIHVLSPQKESTPNGFTPTPTHLFGLLLVISLIIAAIERKRQQVCRVWDALLFTPLAICGILMLALFCSQHPTTSTNLQILLISPLIVFFLPSIYRNKTSRFWKIETILLVLFLFGSCFQDYAEGTLFLAQSLLTRCYIHRKAIIGHHQDGKKGDKTPQGRTI